MFFFVWGIFFLGLDQVGDVGYWTGDIPSKAELGLEILDVNIYLMKLR